MNIERIEKKRTCKICRIVFIRLKFRPSEFGKCCSLRCSIDYKKNRLAKGSRLKFRKKTGVKGVIPDGQKLYVQTDAFLLGREWQLLRYKAFKLYGRNCCVCGETGKLHVDHIKPRCKYPELAKDINNLQILCADCNLGKGGWDETDWRPAALSLAPIKKNVIIRRIPTVPAGVNNKLNYIGHFKGKSAWTK